MPGSAWLRTEVTSKMTATIATTMNAANGALRSVLTDVSPLRTEDVRAHCPGRRGVVRDHGRK
jgi:hypothetical protein